MTAELSLRTPLATSIPVELGGRLWRKQVMRFGEFVHGGRTLLFDADYGAKLAASFKDQAFDEVPLLLASDTAHHTKMPDRAVGSVKGVEVTDTGVDAVFELNDEASRLVKEHPKLGVSVGLYENYERSDGKFWPVALRHVAGTFEPALAGMTPWQAVEAATDDAPHLLDLTSLTLASEGGLETTTSKEDTMANVAEQLTADELAKLRAILAKDTDPGKDDKAEPEQDNDDTDDTDESGDDDGQELTDAEIDDIAARVLADAENDEAKDTTEVAAADDGSNEALELANARLDSMTVELARLRSERDEQKYTSERAELAAEFGIPPRITDLARPLLQGSGRTVELANGKTVDAGAVMRKVLREVGSMVKMLDLSDSFGQPVDIDKDDDTAKVRGQKIEAMKSVFGQS